MLFLKFFFVRNKMNAKNVAFINSHTTNENTEEKLRVSHD